MVKKMFIALLLVVGLVLLMGLVWSMNHIKPVSSEAKEAIEKLLDNLEVKSPYRYRHLTIFPITLHQLKKFDLLTLDEAVDRGYLTVKEVGTGTVPQLEVENQSDRYVFLMSGELLSGGKQDRIVAKDTLIPPHSGKIRIAVYCSERGRWVAKTDKFQAPKIAANINLRQAAKMAASPGEAQQRVWDNVATVQRNLKVEAPTGAMYKSFEAKPVQERSKPYISQFDNLPDKYRDRMAGVVVAIGGRIICADIFHSPKLFHKLWDKLLKSYVLDVVSWEAERVIMPPIEVSVKDVERFLGQAGRATFRYADTPGVGKIIEVNSPQVSGSALFYKDIPVHFDLFPKPGIEKPPIRPLIGPSQRRQIQGK